MAIPGYCLIHIRYIEKIGESMAWWSVDEFTFEAEEGHQEADFA